MSTKGQLERTEAIAGYTYGTADVARSPISLEELRRLEVAVNLTDEDERYLRMAGEVLADQASEIHDHWHELQSQHPYLAIYSAHPDGTPNPEYGEASHLRVARWILDVCDRPRDQAWLDYQQEIALRHTRAKKNRTDAADSVEHIPLRYVLAFTAPVVVDTRKFLARKGHSPEEVERMHAAWTKAVLLSVTLWSRAYLRTSDW